MKLSIDFSHTWCKVDVCLDDQSFKLTLEININKQMWNLLVEENPNTCEGELIGIKLENSLENVSEKRYVFLNGGLFHFLTLQLKAFLPYTTMGRNPKRYDEYRWDTIFWINILTNLPHGSLWVFHCIQIRHNLINKFYNRVILSWCSTCQSCPS